MLLAIMTIDSLLVAGAGIVFVFIVVFSLILGGKRKGRVVASRPGPNALRALENRKVAGASDSLEQEEPPAGEGTSRHIYDFFA